MSAERRARRAALTALAVAGLSAIAPAAQAATVTQHGSETQVDVNPHTENPCTGAMGVLVDDERDSWSVATRSDGSYLARGHSVVRITFTPYDPAEESYAGHETFSSVEHVSRGADGSRHRQRVHLRSSTGARLVFVEWAHLTITPNGRVVVKREHTALTCG